MLSSADCSHIVDSAFQLIDSSVDPEELFNEACSLSKRLKLQNETSRMDASMESFLSVTCQDHQRKFYSCSRVVHPILNLAQQVIDLGKDCCHTQEPLLSHEALRNFENILMYLKAKTDDFWYDGRLFESMVIKHNLSLEMVWNLQRIGAMSLDVYMSSKLNEEPFFIENFSQELVSLYQGSSDSCNRRQRIVLGLTEYLIKTGFGEDKSTLKRSALLIIDSVIKAILDLKVSADEVKFLASPTDFLNYSENIPKSILKRFSTHAISYMLSCRADAVSETLSLNTDWRSLDSFETTRALFKQLFLPLSCEDVAGILIQSLGQLHINEALTFILLSTMHRSYQKSAKVIYAHIKSQLADGLDNSNTAKIAVAFLLARQSSAIGCDGFLSYAEWFESTFGGSSHLLAATKPTFVCLIKFLSQLVPSEPAEYLKVHIMKRPIIPSKCKNIYDDYIALAKTRLEDLKVPLHDIWKGIYDKPAPLKDGCSRKDVNQAEDDVEKAVEAFAVSGKIPIVLIEASIFRKPYFVGKFLPALLKPRHLPDEPDMKMRLISEMNSSGKIPQSLYNNYLEGCEKEKQTLLEGVFDDDDDDLEEMALPPKDQLSLRLNKYVEAVISGNHNKAAECLGLMSEKVNQFLSASSSSSPPAVGHKVLDDGALLLDLTKPSSNDCSNQVVSDIMCHVSILINKWNMHEEMGQQRLRYLVGIDRLISGLIKNVPHLKSMLWLYILFSLTSQVKMDHMFAVAVVCVSLAPVVDPVNVNVKRHDSSTTQSSYRNIVHAVAENLYVHGVWNLDIVLRFWLNYVETAICYMEAEEMQLCDSDVVAIDHPSATESQLFPGHVVNQIVMLCRRQGLESVSQRNSRAKNVQPMSAVASFVLSNPRWKSMSLQHQPTIADWLDLELSPLVQTDNTLSPLERADYMWDMSLSLLQSSSNSINPSGLCCEVLRILSHRLLESSRHSRCGFDEIPIKNLEVFLQLLRRHLTSMTICDMANTSWIVSILEAVEEHPYKDALLRLIIELPPHLLFTHCQTERVSRFQIESSVTVLSHFSNSKQNNGGFLSEKATVFFVQAVVWAQDNAASVCDLMCVLEHHLMTSSVLEHRKRLEEEGLLKQLDTEWTSKLFTSLQWAQRLVDKGSGCCVVQGSLNVWYQATALFIVLLHKQLDDVVLEGSMIRSQSDVFVCLLELVVAHLAVNHDLLGSVDSSCKRNVFVSTAIRILTENPNVLVRLLDWSDSSFSEMRSNLGLSHQPKISYLRDNNILWFAAQIPAHILFRNTCENLTLSVVKAYIRVLQYTYDREIVHGEIMDKTCQFEISSWIKLIVDLSKESHLKQIDVPDSQMMEADLLLFQYIRDKKRGWM